MREIENSIRQKCRHEHVQTFGTNPTNEIAEESVRFYLKQPRPDDLVTLFDMISGTLGMPLNEDRELEFVKRFYHMFFCFPSVSFVVEFIEPTPPACCCIVIRNPSMS